MPNLSFFVAGVPVQQGSKVPGKRRDGSMFVREAAKGHKAWRTAVKEAAEAALLASDEWDVDEDNPVQAVLAFVFPHISSGRYWKTSAPDLDKLTRCVLDALTTARVYRDDSRVVHLEATKVHGLCSGVGIHLRTLPSTNHPIEGALAA